MPPIAKWLILAVVTPQVDGKIGSRDHLQKVHLVAAPGEDEAS